MKTSQTLTLLFLFAVCCQADLLSDLEVKCNQQKSCQIAMSAVAPQIKQMKMGITYGAEITETVNKGFKKGITEFGKKCTKMMEKVGPWLRAIGPAAEIIGFFIPSSQEQMLEEVLNLLKELYNVVNYRFDRVLEKLSDATALIKDQHLRSQYRESKDRIVHSSEVMHLMINATRAAQPAYRKQLKDVKGKAQVEYAAYRLETGLRDGRFISVFMTAENSNRTRVHDRLLQHYNLILQGVKFYLYWLEIKSEDEKLYDEVFRLAERMRWERKLIEDLEIITRIDREYFTENWETTFSQDFEAAVKVGGTNSQVAERAYTLLSGKYDWREWLVLVYDAISSFKNHATGMCQRPRHIQHFRWHNKNVVLLHQTPGKVLSKGVSYTQALLGRAKTQKNDPICGKLNCRDRWVDVNDAGKIYDTFPVEATSCSFSEFVAVIRSTANVQIRAPDETFTVLTRHGMDLVAMG